MIQSAHVRFGSKGDIQLAAKALTGDTVAILIKFRTIPGAASADRRGPSRPCRGAVMVVGRYLGADDFPVSHRHADQKDSRGHEGSHSPLSEHPSLASAPLLCSPVRSEFDRLGPKGLPETHSSKVPACTNVRNGSKADISNLDDGSRYEGPDVLHGREPRD